MSMRRLALAGVLAAAAVLTGACGDDAEERRLSSKVTTIREAVMAEDRVAARSAIRDLQGAVASLQADGSVTADRAGRILAAADMVLDQLSLLPAPSPPSVGEPSQRAPGSGDEGQEQGGEERGVPPDPESNPG